MIFSIKISALLSLLVALCSCNFFGPSVNYGNGYYYVDINSENRFIERRFSKNSRELIVGPNIVAIGNNVPGYLVALRQIRLDKSESKSDISYGAMTIENECEFYVINIKDALVLGPLNFKDFTKPLFWSNNTGMIRVCNIKLS